MKIRFATFALAKYGGIIAHIEAKFKALKELGHDVDIIILEYAKNVNYNTYINKLEKLESGEFQDKLNIKSQNGGYYKSSVTNYWVNPYYGWLLKPNENKIACLNEEGLNNWYKAVEDVDLIIWSFVPTKTSESKGFNWWHKYFELPETTTQILSIHDGYYDMRNSWTNLLSNKIDFFECVHITSYNACQVFDIPRILNYDSRFIKKSVKKLKPKKDRNIDFFAAHIFKSMKKMEDFILSVPYLSSSDMKIIAGSGIELYYMMTDVKEKQKPKYTVSKKTDPDCLDKDIGESIWKRAEEYDMEYLGLISNDEVDSILKNCKFAIDPSFSTHYAKYVNTHLNGFIIEAIINGAYPVLRNYRKDEVENDFIFQNLKAVYIPYDATPKEFAEKLNEANNMSDEKFKSDITYNFNLAKDILNPVKNVSKILELVNDKEKIKELKKGNSNTKLQLQSLDIMKDHFKYEFLPNWMVTNRY